VGARCFVESSQPENLRANHPGRGPGVADRFANLFFKVASAERITADEMQQLIERPDADKLKKALSKIQETEKLLIQGGTK